MFYILILYVVHETKLKLKLKFFVDYTQRINHNFKLKAQCRIADLKMTTTVKLSQEFIDKVREVFDVFDAEHDGEDEMDIPDLGTFIRAFGQILSQAEVQEIIDEVDADGL